MFLLFCILYSILIVYAMFWLIFIWLKETNGELSLELLRLLPLETMESYLILAAIKKATVKTACFTACYPDHYFH